MADAVEFLCADALGYDDRSQLDAKHCEMLCRLHTNWIYNVVQLNVFGVEEADASR